MAGLLTDLSKDLATTGLIAISQAINKGRDVGFGAIKDQLGAFQWSAILDGRECPECSDLDGKYFDPNNPNVSWIEPPLHSRCRCIYVGVLKDEIESYEVPVEDLTRADAANYARNKWWLGKAGVPSVKEIAKAEAARQAGKKIKNKPK